MIDVDVAGSIGRRYRRQDEVGTPLCVTIDFDTLDDDAVTVRDRDTMEQERVPIDGLVDELHGIAWRAGVERDGRLLRRCSASTPTRDESTTITRRVPRPQGRLDDRDRAARPTRRASSTRRGTCSPTRTSASATTSSARAEGWLDDDDDGRRRGRPRRRRARRAAGAAASDRRERRRAAPGAAQAADDRAARGHGAAPSRAARGIALLIDLASCS